MHSSKLQAPSSKDLIHSLCARLALGLACVIGGSGLDFVALGFMPQSLATPVGGSTMVANVAFASLFLKEKFSRRVRSLLRGIGREVSLTHSHRSA